MNDQPLNKEQALETILKVLREALKADPTAITHLIEHRVECELALADHPTIQVHQVKAPAGGLHVRSEFQVGLLGIINGIVEPLTGARVAAVFDDNNPQVLTDFIKYTPPAHGY